MAPLQNRTLFHAVLLSLAVHALILFGRMPEVRRALDVAAPPPALVATIAEPQPEPQKKEEPRPPSPPRVREPVPGAQQPAPVTAPAPERTLPLEAPAARRTAEPAPAPPPAVSVSAQARAAATEAATARTIAQYRREVIGAAAAFNRYPRLARENNWEGAVEVEMRVRGDGSLAALAVTRGSGHEVLDDQALDMFRQAQERVPLPPALRGRDFSIPLKAIYRLKDAAAGS